MAAAARRYAEAYFDLAREAGKLEEWGAELQHAQQTLSDSRLVTAMTNPRVRRPQRIELAMKRLERVSPQARNLVRLLVFRGRLRILGEVVTEYDKRVAEASGIVRAVVSSAVDLDSATKRRIARTLGERFEQPVEVEGRVDRDVVGGLVIRVGDRVIDTSVRTHLQQLQAFLA